MCLFILGLPKTNNFSHGRSRQLKATVAVVLHLQYNYSGLPKETTHLQKRLH